MSLPCTWENTRDGDVHTVPGLIQKNLKYQKQAGAEPSQT